LFFHLHRLFLVHDGLTERTVILDECLVNVAKLFDLRDEELGGELSALCRGVGLWKVMNIVHGVGERVCVHG
jgi:hypothetical protein